MASKQEMLEMAARLRATVSESKRQMLDEAADMLCEAAEAVERMTPRPVKDKHIVFPLAYARCPRCDCGTNECRRYCDICGQALDWGES